MANKTSRTSSPSAGYRKKLGAFFTTLSDDLKASSRRVQLYGEALLTTIIESGVYSDDPLCSKDGVSAIKNALKFYNIGTTALSDSSAGATDLDGMSDGYKEHVAHGLKIFDETVDLGRLDGADLLAWRTCRDILASHHERWDGSGYPEGISTTDIPLAARICAVVNYFETLTTSSFERDKMTTEAAAEEIEKRSGTYFDPEITAAMVKTADKINEALENGTVAKVTAGTSTVRAIEQLYRTVYDYGNHVQFGYYTDLRLNDPELGVVSSSVFLPVAEQSSKINELCKWAMEEACGTIAHLKRKNRFTGEFFVPMSVKSLLKKNFVSNLARIVRDSGAEPSEICVTVSDNIFIHNIDRVAESFAELHELGFKLAIGGVGSSSVDISVFQSLEPDFVFLDSEFVADIITSPRAKKVVSAVIELSNKLDIIVIADGVTAKDQAKELYAMGCNVMCGTYYGRYTAVTVI